MSETRGVPYHCPYCGDEDLRPVAEPRDGWLCRPCARIFSVKLHGIDRSAVPGHVAATRPTAAAGGHDAT